MQSAGIAPDIYSYNGVIDAYGKSKQYMQMESVLRVMRAAHCKPDLVTYNTLLDAYGRVADFAKMEQVGFLYNLCFLWDFGAGFSAQMLHILDLFPLRKWLGFFFLFEFCCYQFATKMISIPGATKLKLVFPFCRCSKACQEQSPNTNHMWEHTIHLCVIMQEQGKWSRWRSLFQEWYVLVSSQLSSLMTFWYRAMGVLGHLIKWKTVFSNY